MYNFQSNSTNNVINGLPFSRKSLRGS